MTKTATVTTLSKLVDYYIWFANDVGSYLSNQKLQKLLYYAQAWYLAFEDKPLFDEDFEAWVHGPTIPALFHEYQEQFGFKPILKEVEKPKFPEEVQQFLDELSDEYFFCDAYELELMVRREAPYQFQIFANEYGRVHGFFSENIFYIVWLDPEHNLYS